MVADTILFAIENELVNTEDIKDVVMVIASSHREGIVERADDISKTLGQDSLEKLLHLIPISRMPLTKSVNTGRATIWYTCLGLLVLGTLSNKLKKEQRQLKIVLPELQKFLVCRSETFSMHVYFYIQADGYKYT